MPALSFTSVLSTRSISRERSTFQIGLEKLLKILIGGKLLAKIGQGAGHFCRRNGQLAPLRFLTATFVGSENVPGSVSVCFLPAVPMVRSICRLSASWTCTTSFPASTT